jgi:virginiamycin B lyase
MRAVAVVVASVLAACGPSVAPSPSAAPAASPTPRASVGIGTNVPIPISAQKPPGPMRLTIREYPLPSGQGPHDVAPARDGGIWYTAQRSGELGWLDPGTGTTRAIRLGAGSAPHGVIVGPDGAPWITDGGLNALVRVDPATNAVQRFPLPASRPNANLNTATFDRRGILWFTGQSGVYGQLDPSTGAMVVYDAPKGSGPYGITTTRTGDVYFASLAGSFLGRIDVATGKVTVLEPPTAGQGARRVWSDSVGRVWITEWNVGKIASYDPAANAWREYPIELGARGSQPYAVYVAENDVVWVSDFAQNAILDFDIASGSFHSSPLPTADAAVRQLHGRPGEIWGAESARDKLAVIRIGP